MNASVPERLQVWPEAPRAAHDGLEFSARIEGPRSDQRTLWFRYPAERQSQVTDSADPFLLGTFFHAMRLGIDLHVHGCVSPSLLSNLEEVQAAWASWCPSRYRMVQLTAEREAEEERSDSGQAVTTFSGGLDSCFTIWRHAKGEIGRRRRRLGLALMVHGFDIPLEQVDAFQRAAEKAKRITDSVGLELVPLASNIRQLEDDWEEVHGAALASCLHLFRKGFSGGLIASSHAYNALRFPWGSNPITDPLLSTQGFPITYDGAEVHRMAKANAVADWSAAMENLRVCWSGEHKDRNCGTCSRCVGTAICFAIAKKPVPGILNVECLDCAVKGLKAQSIPAASLVRYGELLSAARGSGLREPWVRSLSTSLRYHHLKAFFRFSSSGRHR